MFYYSVVRRIDRTDSEEMKKPVRDMHIERLLSRAPNVGGNKSVTASVYYLWYAVSAINSFRPSEIILASDPSVMAERGGFSRIGY